MVGHDPFDFVFLSFGTSLLYHKGEGLSSLFFKFLYFFSERLILKSKGFEKQGTNFGLTAKPRASSQPASVSPYCLTSSPFVCLYYSTLCGVCQELFFTTFISWQMPGASPLALSSFSPSGGATPYLTPALYHILIQLSRGFSTYFCFAFEIRLLPCSYCR